MEAAQKLFANLVNKAREKKLDNREILWLSKDISVPVSRRKKTKVVELFG